MQAQTGDVVRIHYTGRLTDGTAFESSIDDEPMQFEIGAGAVIAGLEKGVVGMEVGQSRRVEIPAGDAYGPRREDFVVEVSRTEIPAEIELVEGLELRTHRDDGQLVPLRVIDLAKETVTLDANHPLAGEDLVFELELVEIAAARA